MKGCNLRWVWLLLVPGLLISCSRQDRIVLSNIVVNAPRQLDDDVEDKEAIRTRIEQLVGGTPGIVVDAKAPSPTHFMQVWIGDVFSQGAGSGEEFRRVEVVLRAHEKGHQYRVEGRGRTPERLGDSVVDGFEDAWRLITLQRQATAVGGGAYINMLSSSDWRLREFALDRIAMSSFLAAVPALCDALSTERLAVLQLRIIGVLTELGDRRAVRPLIALTRNQRAGLVLHVLHALGSIGGREAEAFLVTVASGHSIEGVRGVATQIIGDMQAATEAKLR